jgi:PAS domain S-box-containing protein
MAMVVTDARAADQPILFVNDAFTRLTGYTAEDAIGRNCRFMQGEGTRPEHVTQLREAIRSGLDIGLDILNYRKDGSAFWNALYISPVRDAGERSSTTSAPSSTSATRRSPNWSCSRRRPGWKRPSSHAPAT